jgi:hypothetical protein
MLRFAVIALVVACASAAHLRVDPVQTAGDKSLTAAQTNASVADVNKKVSYVKMSKGRLCLKGPRATPSAEARTPRCPSF